MANKKLEWAGHGAPWRVTKIQRRERVQQWELQVPLQSLKSSVLCLFAETKCQRCVLSLLRPATQEKTEQTAASADVRARAGADRTLDARVTDADAKSCSTQNPSKALESQEKEKKLERLEARLKRGRHFTPFARSVGGALGREADTF